MQPLPPANSAAKSGNPPRFQALPRISAAAALGTGMLILLSWHAHWQAVLQLLPGTAPMKYNTALCFMLLGAGLWLLTTRHRNAAVWTGVLPALIGTLTLLEYVTGLNAGIDLLFFKPWFQAATSYPGRMSPLTACCFIFLGLGLVLSGRRSGGPRRFAGAGLLACLVGVIGGIALCGYAFGMESASGWGAYSHMAVNTSALFLLYACGLLAWTWEAVGKDNHLLLRGLPAAGSVTLMVMVGIVTMVNTRDLRKATYWRQHTFDVILSSQNFLDDLLDAQRGVRGYVTLGDTNSLAAFRSGEERLPQSLATLTTETRDNPAQQARLKNLDDEVQAVLAFDERLIMVYHEGGFAAVSKLDESGQGRALFGGARDTLKDFSTEERRLLTTRSASEAADYNNVARLLVMGCTGAAGLLLAGNLIASREMRWRRRTESRLTAILTLQGAILRSSSYGIVALDRHGIVTTFNPAAEKLLGYGAEEVVGKITPDQWTEIKPAPAASRRLGMDTLLARAGVGALGESETTYLRKDGQRFPALVSTTALADGRGEIKGFLCMFADITERRQREAERDKLIAELKEALAEVNALSNLVPICAWCKNIRSDKGYWQTVEQYVQARTHATFTHGICPQCAEKMLADAE